MKQNEVISSVIMLFIAWCMLLLVCVEEIFTGHIVIGLSLGVVLIMSAVICIKLIDSLEK